MQFKMSGGGGAATLRVRGVESCYASCLCDDSPLSHQDAESRFPLLLSFLMMQSMRQRCPMLDSGESPQFVGVHALVPDELPDHDCMIRFYDCNIDGSLNCHLSFKVASNARLLS